METDDYWIPRELDAPPLFFTWDFDIAMIFIVIVVIASVMGMPLLGVLLACCLTRLYAQIKNEGGDGFLSKVLYWYAPLLIFDCPRLPSSIREYVGE